jgi:hypothetical protein
MKLLHLIRIRDWVGQKLRVLRLALLRRFDISRYREEEQAVKRLERYRAQIGSILNEVRGSFDPSVWSQLHRLEQDILKDLDRSTTMADAREYIRWRLDHFQPEDSRTERVFLCLRNSLSLCRRPA